MDTQDCIRSRKSSRKFTDKEVSSELVYSVVQDAMRAPSYKNSQPWEVVAVAGQKKEELSRILNRLLEEGVTPEPDIPEPPAWPDVIAARIADTMDKRNRAFKVEPTTNAALKSKQANYNFYGAPAALFFYQEASLGPWSLLDMGMFIENVILGFHSRGVATVPQAFLTDYSAQVKSFLGIGENKRLVLGMSVGYPDPADPRALFVSPRANVDEIFRWVK